MSNVYLTKKLTRHSNKFGSKYKSKAEIAGGIILVLIVLKIFLEGVGIPKLHKNKGGSFQTIRPLVMSVSPVDYDVYAFACTSHDLTLS